LLKILYKRVIKPLEKEVSANPAARSARLRAAEKS
jgi:16S rRNA C1402 N4-methylase RsmH